MSNSKQRLLSSIVSFLQKEGEKDENFKQVSDNLKKIVKTEEVDYSLLEIFEEGEKVLKQTKPVIKKEKKVVTEEDVKFKEFLEAITKKGYFGDFQIGSPEYNLRLEKAKDRYLLKVEENKKKAEEFKDQGNQFVKDKKFEDAVQAYLKGIETFPTAVLYSNLAFAYTQLKDDENGLKSGLKSIEIDPKYAKGYSRVAINYYNMKKDEEALKYITKALELEPNNKSWLEMKDELEQNLKPKKSQSNNNFGFDPSMLSGMFGGQGGSGGLDLGSILNNPQFMNMATSMLQNPQMQQMMSSLMGGQSQPIPKESIETLKGMEEYSTSSKIKKFVDDVEQNGMGAITKYMGDPEVQKFVFKMAQGTFGNGVNPFSQFGGQGNDNNNEDPDTSNLYL